MRIGLTYDLKTDYCFKPGDPPDANAEFDHPSTIEMLADCIRQCGFDVKKIGNVWKVLENFQNLEVDLVFNIAEGVSGRNRESQVPLLLEMAGIPFVGSDALTLGLTLDKLMAKKVFLAEKIPTPRFFEIKSEQDLVNLDHLRFPLIAKPRFEGSSKGLDDNSYIKNIDQLREVSLRLLHIYKQPVLVEEFIEGGELAVPIVGNDPPVVLGVVQIEIDGSVALGDKFYTFGHIHSDRLKYRCPALLPQPLLKKVEEIALAVYQAVECKDFGRVDMRIDKGGNPYVLEINPLPSLSTEDVFKVVSDFIGIEYHRLIGRIINSAMRRYGLT